MNINEKRVKASDGYSESYIAVSLAKIGTAKTKNCVIVMQKKMHRPGIEPVTSSSALIPLRHWCDIRNAGNKSIKCCTRAY